MLWDLVVRMVGLKVDVVIFCRKRFLYCEGIMVVVDYGGPLRGADERF